MIKTEDVRINTMQVEIRSLMVGKKQLTLSLMRQFLEESIIDHEKIALKGIPWGHINYFWGDDKYKYYPNYIHVIWQRDIYLRRCIVPMSLGIKSNRTEIQWHNEIIEELKVHEMENSFSFRRIADEDRRKERVVKLRKDLEEARGSIKNGDDYNNIYIPNYLKLVEPFKNLEHFYIAV